MTWKRIFLPRSATTCTAFSSCIRFFAHSSRKPGTMTTYAAFITCVRFFTCPSMLKCYAQRALYLVSGEPIKLLKTTSLTTSLVL